MGTSMRRRWVSAFACAAAIAIITTTTVATAIQPAAALAVPGMAYAASPSPSPGAGAKAGAGAAKDNGERRWAVRPAGKNGKADARTHFTLQATPGGTVSEAALVTNLSPVPVTYQVYGTDAFNTPAGGFDLLSAEKKPTDVGSWMAFGQKAVTVPAGGTVAVPFTIAVPATATPGDHAGGVVVSLVSARSSGGQQVNVESRVAVRVYLRIPGDLRPLLSVGSVTARYRGVGNPFGHGRVTIGYTVTNRGNIRLRGHPKVTVTNALGSVLATLTPEDLPEVLPNQRVTFSAVADRVFPAGPLTVKVSLDSLPDPEQPVGQTIPAVSGKGYVWAVSWILVLLAGIVLAALVTLVWLRRRRMLARLDRAIASARGRARRPESGASAPAVPAGAGSGSKAGSGSGSRGGRR
jgi:hypothetical protein